MPAFKLNKEKIRNEWTIDCVMGICVYSNSADLEATVKEYLYEQYL